MILAIIIATIVGAVLTPIITRWGEKVKYYDQAEPKIP